MPKTLLIGYCSSPNLSPYQNSSDLKQKFEATQTTVEMILKRYEMNV